MSDDFDDALKNLKSHLTQPIDELLKAKPGEIVDFLDISIDNGLEVLETLKKDYELNYYVCYENLKKTMEARDSYARKSGIIERYKEILNK